MAPLQFLFVFVDILRENRIVLAAHKSDNLAMKFLQILYLKTNS